MSQLITLVSVIFLLVGCQAHVRLNPPPLANAPIKERVKAYDELKPIVHRELYVYNGYGAAYQSLSSLTLGSGQRVYYPEDLLPVVGQDNKFADWTRQYQRYNNIGTTVMWSGLGVELLGCSLALAGLNDSIKTPGSGFSTTIVVGYGLLFAGLIGVLTGYMFETKAIDSKATAFDLYDSVLLKRLELARTGTNTVLVPTNQVE